MNVRNVRTRYLLIAGLVLLVVAVQQAWRHGHDYVWAEKYLVVVPGKLYRGAWQYRWPMRRIIRQDHIKTIVALAHPPDSPMVSDEKALAEGMGVRWVHVPIVEESVSSGERKTVGDALERAAAILADPKSQPVYFHCHHGINRTSMVQMAYRMLHCGWTLEQAQDEIARTPIGLVEARHGVDYRYMATFYAERVLPRRRAGQALAEARSGTAR